MEDPGSTPQHLLIAKSFFFTRCRIDVLSSLLRLIYLFRIKLNSCEHVLFFLSTLDCNHVWLSSVNAVKENLIFLRQNHTRVDILIRFLQPHLMRQSHQDLYIKLPWPILFRWWPLVEAKRKAPALHLWVVGWAEKGSPQEDAKNLRPKHLLFHWGIRYSICFTMEGGKRWVKS